MIPLSLDEVRELAPGRLEAAPEATESTGLRTDSRRVEPGDLFVAVGGGTAFLADALERGASAALVPDDAFAALAALAGRVRDRSAARFVGITGSMGKTSTKDILAALCRRHASTIAAEARYYAELGVRQTLWRDEAGTEICVLELAMRGLGQIAALCEIARPHIGVVTTIAPVHLELVGSLDGVARAKAELLDALPEGAVAVIPAASELDPYVAGNLDVRRFGAGGDARLLETERTDDGLRVRVDVRGRVVELDLNLGARHQAENAVAALLAFEALGLPLDEVQAGADGVELSRWRGEESPLPGGGLLINDAWNASPLSMRAAIDHLVDVADGRSTLAVLGDMAELGPDAAAYHREIGEYLRGAGVDGLLAVGPLAAEYVAGAGFGEAVPDVEAAQPTILSFFMPGNCVLIKASRSMGLEALAEHLSRIYA
jgi:UDP-N-acetylmuramoyl-tripeptide--D-alanyl-D-alanine ligase